MDLRMSWSEKASSNSSEAPVLHRACKNTLKYLIWVPHNPKFILLSVWTGQKKHNEVVQYEHFLKISCSIWGNSHPSWDTLSRYAN